MSQICQPSYNATLLVPFADLLREDASSRISELIERPRWNEDILAKEPYVD